MATLAEYPILPHTLEYISGLTNLSFVILSYNVPINMYKQLTIDRQVRRQFYV